MIKVAATLVLLCGRFLLTSVLQLKYPLSLIVKIIKFFDADLYKISDFFKIFYL